MPLGLGWALVASAGWAGHASCHPLSSSLVGRMGILAPEQPPWILPSRYEHGFGLLSALPLLPVNQGGQQGCWILPGNKMSIFVPPALHVTSAFYALVENAALQHQSPLIEQQMLVAQTRPTIFDGWKIQYLVRLL